MPKLQAFIIRFDNSTAVYYGGQWVTGNVFISLSEPMKMRNVRVKFLGQAHCYWTESRTQTTQVDSHHCTGTDTIHYAASEVYFDFSEILWGKQPGDSGDDPVMAAGNYEFPFKFQLPPHCPTSFEGSWGHIRYIVKATIDKPWKFNHDTKAAFTVIQLVDLNMDPVAQQPRQAENSKTLGSLFWKAGEIDCTVQMPRTGFVPGEVIPYTIQINNNTVEIRNSGSRSVKDIRVLFKQNVTFRANWLQAYHTAGAPMHGAYLPMHGTPGMPIHAVGVPMNTQRVQSKTLCEVRDEKDVKPGEHRTISTMEPGAEAMIIRVPPVPPVLATCGIISINYDLEIVCNPSGLSTDLTTTIPLVIGSIPLRQQFQYIQPSPITVQPSAPPVPMSELYPDLPPPSYEECVDGKSNIKDETDNDYTKGDLEFAPRYMHYGWSRFERIMPKLQAFVIRFDNPTAVYYVGQWVTGKVLVSLGEPMKMRDVRAKFRGQAHCYLTETSGIESEDYEASEVYFDFCAFLWGKQPADTGDNPVMAAGINEFPFQFQLPPNCPTSFEGNWGQIRYTVEAAIDKHKPWKSDHNTKAAFSVIQVVDLNLDPMAQQPRQVENCKTLRNLFWNAGKIECTMQVPRTGFVPGEMIPYTIQVNNASSCKIKNIRILLKQTVIYRANRLHESDAHDASMQTQKITNKILCEVRDEKNVEPGESRIISTMEPSAEAMVIRVPPVPPVLTTCRIISIMYHLEFLCKPSGFSTDLISTFPLLIGSIPLRQNFPFIQPASPSAIAPVAIQCLVPPVPMSEQYPDLPPPSYEECVGGKSNIRDTTDSDHTQGDLEFAPRYTYYDWSRQLTAPPRS